MTIAPNITDFCRTTLLALPMNGSVGVLVGVGGVIPEPGADELFELHPGIPHLAREPDTVWPGSHSNISSSLSANVTLLIDKSTQF